MLSNQPDYPTPIYSQRDSFSTPTEFTTLPSSITLTPGTIATPYQTLTRQYQTSSKYQKQIKYCGCFKSRGSCCSFFTFILLLLLGGIGAGVYFCWPRMPIISIGAFRPSSTPLQIFGVPRNASLEVPFKIDFFGTVESEVASENLIDWVFDFVRMRGGLVDKEGNTYERVIGYGELNDILIEKTSTTRFNFPIKVSYWADEPTFLLRDPAFTAVLGACNLLESTGLSVSELTFQYEIEFQLRLIAWTGYQIPKITREISFPCPIVLGDIQKLQTLF